MITLSRHTFLAATCLTVAAATAAPAFAQEQPGDGTSIRMARPTWDTGWFHPFIYRAAFEEMGYEVSDFVTLDNPAFYQAVGNGDVDLWVNGWFPQHDTYADVFEEGADKLGYVMKKGGVQGYMIDKKTADEHGVTNLSDFKDPEIAKLFDANGNGKADMVACPPGWACELGIEHHVDVYGLRDTVETLQANYSAGMADALGRFQSGGSIFFYTWTPNWTVGLLKPGEDVVWIEVPEPALTEEQAGMEEDTIIEDVEGCVSDPCSMGWVASDIRPTANTEFLNANPAIKTFLEIASIPKEDIFEQNAKMYEGEDSESDLERHAQQWIEENRETFDGWLEEARAAAQG